MLAGPATNRPVPTPATAPIGTHAIFTRPLPANPHRASMVSLDAIHQLVRQGREDPVVRRKAAEILREAGVAPSNRRAIIHAVHAWVQTNVEYVHDPENVELLTWARGLVEQAEAGVAIEDCDGFVILEHSILNALSVPTRTVIIKADAQDPSQWSHIFLEAHDGQRWVTLDPIMKQKPVGWHPPRFYEKRTVDIGPGPKFVPEGLPAGWKTEPVPPPSVGGSRSVAARLSSWGCCGVTTDSRVGFLSGAAGMAGYAGFGDGPAIPTEVGEIADRAPSRAAFLAAWPAWHATFPPGTSPHTSGLLLLSKQQADAERTAIQTHLEAEREAGYAAAIAALPQQDASLAGLQDELDNMIVEAMKYAAELPATIKPLVDVITANVGRIKEAQDTMRTVNYVASAAVIVLDLLAVATAGITEVLAIAVAMGNLAWQMRQLAHIMEGSAMRTIREASGAAISVANTVEWAQNLIDRANRKWYQIQSVRDEIAVPLAKTEIMAPEAPAPLFRAEAARRPAWLLPVAAAAGIAALVFLGRSAGSRAA